MPDGNKKTVGFEILSLPGLYVLEPDTGNPAGLGIAVNFVNDAVPNK